jgi:hypothetical protein
MAQSTLTSAFRTKLFQKFLEGYSGDTNTAVGNAHFIVRAQRTTNPGGGSPVFETVAQSFIPNIVTQAGAINHVIEDHYQISTLANGNVKLTYTGDPVELDISIATTITRLVVVLRERLSGTNTLTNIDQTQDMDFTDVAAFPVSVVFTEPNGTLVVNQLEFEIGDE